MTGRRRTGVGPAFGRRLCALAVAAGVLAGSGAVAIAAPRTRVVVFPFAARGAEQRIYAQSLAQAVAKALDGALLDARVAPRRPAGEDLNAFAAAARTVAGSLAVVGDVVPGDTDEVQLRALLVDVARGTATAPRVETRAPVERLDQGAAVLAAAVKAHAEAWVQRASAASQPRRSTALVYGVDAPVGSDGVDVRVPATKTAYRYVSRELRHRPIPAVTYGLVPARVAATAAAVAGCAGAIMLRIERITLVGGRVPTAVARVTLRAVSARSPVVRDRTLTVTVRRSLGERRELVAARVVAETFGRTLMDLRAALAPRPIP